jgi:hypothetical protein
LAWLNHGAGAMTARALRRVRGACATAEAARRAVSTAAAAPRDPDPRGRDRRRRASRVSLLVV